MKITMPAQDFTRALRAMTHAASAERMWPHLNSVWIVGMSEGRSHMMATNGHWLAVARLPEASDVEPGVVPIERDDVAQVIAAAPKGSLVSSPVTLSTSAFVTKVDYAMRSVTVRSPDVKPPAVYELVPKVKSTGKHERRSLNLDVLEPALRALRAMSPGRRALPDARFYPMGPAALDPVLLWSSKVPDFFAYLMPMRGNGKRDMRWWQNICDEAIAAKKAAEPPPATTAAEAAAE